MKSKQEITSYFNRHIARIMNLLEVATCISDNLKLAIKSNIWDLHDDITESKEYRREQENGTDKND